MNINDKDLCKYCLARGNVQACENTSCSYRESWRYQEQQKEIDHLRARAAELYAALEVSRGQWIHSVNAEYCLKVLNRTPAQSLAAHDARVLRDAAEEHKQERLNDPRCDNGVAFLLRKADRIEAEGRV